MWTLAFLIVSLARVCHGGGDDTGSELALKDEARAGACAEACHDAIHWEKCAKENECNSRAGPARLFCLDSCLYIGINCEFRCWDSYDAIMGTCSRECAASKLDENAAEQCPKNCFLETFSHKMY